MSDIHTRSLKLANIRNRMLRSERFSWSEIASWASSGDIELMGAAFQVLIAKGDNIEGDVESLCATPLLSHPPHRPLRDRFANGERRRRRR